MLLDQPLVFGNPAVANLRNLLFDLVLRCIGSLLELQPLRLRPFHVLLVADPNVPRGTVLAVPTIDRRVDLKGQQVIAKPASYRSVFKSADSPHGR